MKPCALTTYCLLYSVIWGYLKLNITRLLICVLVFFFHCIKYARIRVLTDGILPYVDKIYDFVLIRENAGQWKPVSSHILYSVRFYKKALYCVNGFCFELETQRRHYHKTIDYVKVLLFRLQEICCMGNYCYNTTGRNPISRKC